jgi:hypothetical protein
MNDIYLDMGEAEEDRLATVSRRRDFDVEVSGERGFALESSVSLDAGRILIGQALLRLTLEKGPMALRFLLAHELGHHVTPEAPSVVEQEEQADDFALRTLRGYGQSPMYEPDAATLARFAQGFDDLATDLEQQLARLGGAPGASTSDVKKATLCELAVELHWRASFVREKAVLGRSYTTQDIRRETANIVNQVRSSRRALLPRLDECQAYSTAPSATDSDDAKAARLLVQQRLEAVRERLKKSDEASAVAPADKLLNAPGSEWRDDATVLSWLRAGPWLAFKSHGTLAGWTVGAAFAPPFLTLSESRSSGYPIALAFLVDYARAAETLNAQDTATPDRVLQMLRFGVGGLGDISRRRTGFYSRIRVGFGPAYHFVTKVDGSTSHQWTGFVDGSLGAGYKIFERLRVGGAIGGGLAFDGFVRAYQGDLTGSVELAWYLR